MMCAGPEDQLASPPHRVTLSRSTSSALKMSVPSHLEDSASILSALGYSRPNVGQTYDSQLAFKIAATASFRECIASLYATQVITADERRTGSQ